MKVGFMALLLMIYASAGLSAQNVKGTLAGKITDINGLPLPFVSIAIKDWNVITNTDEQGNYLIKAAAGKHLLIATMLGFGTKNLPVDVKAGSTVTLSFNMTENPLAIREVAISGVRTKSATATRTLIDIRDIPQSIAVVGQKTINQQAAFDLTTIVRNISGITFSGNYSGAGSAQFFNARGFDLNDAQNYRWNGMMIWNWGNNYADNIEQVEFLKGPASILFGDVAPGGVLNFVTKKPLADFGGRFQLKTGSWGLARTSLDLTGPLTKSRNLRFRVNASLEKSKSFRDFVGSDRSFIAPALSWAVTPKLSISTESVIRASSATDDAGLVSPDGTITGLRKLSPSLYFGEPSLKYRFKDQSHFLTAKYELNNAWRIALKIFVAKTSNRPFGIWFDQPDEKGDFARRIYGFNQKSKNGTVSADAYGTFYSGAVKHQLLVGADYQATHYRYTNGGELSVLDTNNIYSPKRALEQIEAPAKAPLRPYVSLIERTGFYFQDQLILWDEKLQILLGIRAGLTRQGNHYYQNELAGTAYEGYQDDIINKKILTPRAGLVFKPGPGLSLYTSYSKGYEINSPDVFAKNYKDYATPPATISSQVEAGAKTNLLSEKLGVTVSLFQIDKHHPYGYVYLDPVNPNYDEYNVYYEGHHRSQGVEIDADGLLLPSLSLTAGASFMRTRVVSDPGYPTGNLLPNAPKVAANIWLHYSPVKTWKGLSIGSGLFYKGRFFSGIANDPKLRIPKSYTWDVSLGYKFKSYELQINAMNLTNQVSYLNPWQFNLFDVRPLRQIIVTFNYRFGKK
ncbi:TonB-dependent receptor [Dyadobacter luticola]|uniref:TonB-dependent receptor n=1 Tax=Dyadobacter luticola TaxID=1979387 RepID=A0A5R9L281_9BACT|nr:TonB-dependent receptor [Dyadobacter luticola]TLV02487.1 TonB-dependent receptor [Dyadobacter luticola]